MHSSSDNLLNGIIVQLAQMVVDGGAVAHLTLLISNNDTKLKRQVGTVRDVAAYNCVSARLVAMR